MSDNLTEPTDVIPEVDTDALELAQQMFDHAEGPTEYRLLAAVFGYLYADANVVGNAADEWTYPDLEATVAAFERPPLRGREADL